MRFFLPFLVVIAAFSAAATAQVKVVTTIPDLTDLVKTIGGEEVETVELVAAGSDPHSVIAKMSLVLKVSRADGLVCMGLNFEHSFLPAVLEKVRKDHLRPGGEGYLEIGLGVQALEIPEDLSRARAVDVHPNGNPHYNMDPDNGRIMAAAIRELLIKIDPQGKAGYEERWQAWDDEAKLRIADWNRRMEPVRGRKVLTYHRSWSYFAHHYGLELAGEVEPKPGLAPTARHLADLAKRAETEGIRVLLMEPWYPDGRVKVLADRGVQVVRFATTAGATKKTEHYLDFHEELVKATLVAFGVEDSGPKWEQVDAPAEDAD